MILKEFQVFLNDREIYRPNDIQYILSSIKQYLQLVTTNKKISYYNAPCAFDIETTSFFRASGTEEREKVAIMYEWTLGLYGRVIVGREWSEFLEVLKTISEYLKTSLNRRVCIYVHNLSYEFQFMRKWLKWEKVFCADSRKPIYALTKDGIEFRCSYLLSGYSLEKIGNDLRNYPVKKLVGNLDYEKMRHSKTPMTQEENAYCVNDVKVVMSYIAERINIDGDISKIPMTKTGYVRNYCRNSCFYEIGKSRKKTYKRNRYMNIMNGMNIEVDEYKQLKRAFQGGFTHANPFYSGKLVYNITSYDFTSSYPCVMVAEKFPMGTSEVVLITSKAQLENNLKLYCCLFDVEFTGLQSVLWQDSYISISRCWSVLTPIVNNGRIVAAERLRTSITEQDYFIIKKFYRWESMKIGKFRRYKKDYLPKDFVSSILKLYGDKTSLKGVDGMEAEYLNSKEMLNACYGMAVTDIVRPEIIYSDDEWKEPKKPDFETSIHNYNNNRGRFLFYPWGVWVTAYARRNLFSGILEFGPDYIYSDTDSIKVKNAESHQKYIDDYNCKIRKQLYTAMDYHGLDRQLIEPMTNDGIKKCLGVWDFDGHYSKFKALRAKAYIVKYSNDSRNKSKDRGKINITVSGLNKQKCVPWMLGKWGENGIFEHFDNNLYVPPEYTGKMTHTYIDEVKQGVLIDYTGQSGEYLELSSIHLDKADYSLSLTKEYVDYIRGIQADTI